MAASAKLVEEHGWESTPCCAHLLQTAARSAIDKCRDVQKLLAAGRKLVGHSKHSKQSMEKQVHRQHQLGDNPLKPIQDVPTRWNSSRSMLERLLTLSFAFKDSTHVLCAVFEDPNQHKHRHLMLDDRQWKLAGLFVKIMQPLRPGSIYSSWRPDLHNIFSRATCRVQHEERLNDIPRVLYK